MIFFFVVLAVSLVFIWTPLAAFLWVTGYVGLSLVIVIGLGATLALIERVWVTVDHRLIERSSPLYLRLALAAVYGVGVGLSMGLIAAAIWG